MNKEKIAVYDIICGREDATKTLATINTSNAFCFDCCNFLKKSTNKSETETSQKFVET